MKAAYTKRWLSVAEQIEKLKRDGLIIADEIEAAHFLRHLNYYRFSGYGLAFEQSRHVFLPGTTFEQVRAAYAFDRSLRDLIYESMEVIELDIRTTVAYTFGECHGPFGHTQATNFYKRFEHTRWQRQLRVETKRSSERFVEHFKNTYQEFPDLPIWAVTEIMSFGTLSRMIEGMEKKDIKRIARRYRMQPLNFVSCLHHLVYIRNLCAHHARLWDRQWTIKPTLPPGKLWSAPLLPGNDHLFTSLLLQKVFMQPCTAEQTFVTDWQRRVETLLQSRVPECPEPLQHMGLTKCWAQHPIWTA
jgi:abortive infection bacteriophage resistance protein